jgi:C1A family cysteine protease
MIDPRTIIDENQDPGVSHTPIFVNPPKATVNIPKYHWVADKPDSRDFIYKPTTLSSTPNTIDLRKLYGTPVEDQGNLGSCTGNAIAEAIEMIDKKNGKNTEISRMFIYYYERLLEGTVNYDSGAYIRDGIKACYTYGAPLESLWPYNISKFRTAPSSTAVQDAAKRKVTLYEKATDFNACINALANGYPVVIGFTVYSSFETGNWYYTTANMPYPNTRSERVLGGHAVLLVGYNNSTQRFIVKNSWGSNWGDNGYFYMPYQVIQNTAMSTDFWVIKNVNNP